MSCYWVQVHVLSLASNGSILSLHSHFFSHTSPYYVASPFSPMKSQHLTDTITERPNLLKMLRRIHTHLPRRRHESMREHTPHQHKKQRQMGQHRASPLGPPLQHPHDNPHAAQLSPIDAGYYACAVCDYDAGRGTGNVD